MTRSSISNDKTTKQPRSAAILLLITAIDTTLRVFIPTIGGMFIGMWFDDLFNTNSLWTIGMIVLGIAISSLLIILQLKSVRESQ